MRAAKVYKFHLRDTCLNIPRVGLWGGGFTEPLSERRSSAAVVNEMRGAVGLSISASRTSHLPIAFALADDSKARYGDNHKARATAYR